MSEARKESQSALFLLGGPPRWATTIDVPMMISANALARIRSRGEKFPSARTLWAMDSGGFTQIGDRGEYVLDDDEFGGMVYRIIDEFGAPPLFVSVLDWMTESRIMQRTGFTLLQHQAFTIESYQYLVGNFPHAPWMPILQGQSLNDYIRHTVMYERAGVDLAALDRVGVGSVCRRQGTRETGLILAELAQYGIRLHGFGIKTQGLRHYGHHLTSADSYAWSAGARLGHIRLPQCTHREADCRNCRDYALHWRKQVLAALDAPKQLSLSLSNT